MTVKGINYQNVNRVKRIDLEIRKNWKLLSSLGLKEQGEKLVLPSAL